MPTDRTNEEPVKRWLAAALIGPGEAGACPDAAAALKLARAEGIAALLHLRAQEGDAAFPDSLHHGLHTAHAQAVALDLLQARATRSVLTALAEAQLPALVLKGAALAHWAYTHSHQRPRADLDLLFVDQAAVARAASILAPLGFVLEAQGAANGSYQCSLQGQLGTGLPWCIDAHWRLTNHPVFAERFSFAELWAESWQIGPGMRILGKPHAFLHACIHRINNLLIGEGDRLIWLLDLHQIGAQLGTADWQRIDELARDKQLAGPCLAAMDACERYFGSNWPASVSDALKQAAATEDFDVDRADSRWYFEWSSLRSRPAHSRLRWLLRKLVPDPDYMRQRYAVEGTGSLASAYLRRWRFGLGVIWRSLTRGR